MDTLNLSLSRIWNISLFLISLVLVGFSQPAWSPTLGVIVSIFGFALIGRVLIAIPDWKKRFWLGTLWFSLVQAIQLSWLLTHPYNYIYAVHLLLAFLMGIQFGLIGICLTPKRISSWFGILGIAGLFTILEWLRLYFFSGFPFNPIGLSLSSTLWGLQGASLGGVFGLSFWILLTNLIFLRAWISVSKLKILAIGIVLALLPYVWGYYHVEKQLSKMHLAKNNETNFINTLLVQTAFPIEENLHFDSFSSAIQFVENEWKEIFKTFKPYQNKQIDLVVLPEYVVPYGTYVALFPLESFKETWVNLFGNDSLKALPPLEEPLAMEVKTKEGKKWQLTNAYFCQALSNLFKADLVVGLQDDQWVSLKEKQSFSSAFYFWPEGNGALRYEKRILLPIAEYIPFEFCKELAKDYGISGSFTPGEAAKVFPGKVPFGMSICYEEAFGDLMRENREKGAELLINLTSDVWYPNSKLPKQHFDHARLRSVEMGIPLVRACNTGITGAFDSLGQIVGCLCEKDEWVRTALFLKVPLYHYSTLYSKTGDMGVVLSSFLLVLLGILIPIRKSP